MLFTFFLIKLGCVLALWTIEILNPSEISIMEKGLFKEMTIEFKPGESTEAISNVNFRLEDPFNIFRTTEPIYTINLYKERTITILIGVTCHTDREEGTLAFVPITMTEEVSKSSDYQITIKTNSAKVGLSLSISSPTISKGEYGVVNLMNYPRNVDDLLIEMKSSNQALGFDYFTVPTYNPKVLSQKIYGKYWLRLEQIELSSSILEVSLQEGKKCFELLTSSFTLTIGQNTIQDTRDLKVNLQFQVPALSQLDIILSDYITPSMLYCVLVSTKQAFPTKAEIINQDYYHINDNSTTRYFKVFLYQTIEKPVFSFKQLNKYEQYKLRCVYRNSAYDESLMSTSSFVSLSSISILKTQLHTFCGNWLVRDLNHLAFEDALMDFCQSNINSKQYIENGCLTCVKRPTDGLFNLDTSIVAKSICITSESSCPVANQIEDTQEKMNNLIISLDSDKKIEANLGVKIELIDIQKEDTLESSDGILIQALSHTPKYYDVSIINTKEGAINCTIEIESQTDFAFKIKTESFILKPNGREVYGFTIPSESYDDDIYSLAVQCRKLLNFDYHSSSVNSEISFTHNATFDCNERPYISRCLSMNYSALPVLSTENPKHVLDIIPLFIQLNPFNQRDALFVYLQYFRSLHTQEDEYQMLNITVLFGEILTYMNCSRSYYNFCRNTKQIIYKEIVSKLRKFFPEGNVHYSDEDKLQAVQISFEVKLLLIGMYYASMNSDGFFNETSRYMLDYATIVFENAHKLITGIDSLLRPEKDDKYIKELNEDLIMLYEEIYDKLINATEFMQRDDFLFANFTNLSIVNPDDSLFQLKTSISGLIKCVIDIQPTRKALTRKNYNVSIYELPSDITQSYNNHTIEMGTVKVMIPVNVLVGIGVKYFSVVYYEKHPMFAINHQSLYETPIVSFILFDQSHNAIDITSLP